MVGSVFSSKMFLTMSFSTNHPIHIDSLSHEASCVLLMCLPGRRVFGHTPPQPPAHRSGKLVPGLPNSPRPPPRFLSAGYRRGGGGARPELREGERRRAERGRGRHAGGADGRGPGRRRARAPAGVRRAGAGGGCGGGGRSGSTPVPAGRALGTPSMPCSLRDAVFLSSLFSQGSAIRRSRRGGEWQGVAEIPGFLSVSAGG